MFRRVRGILNKLTPEKFEKLTVDIINVGLDSTTILKGVILLIFEKALDEPKYSSMYAQLCKRLAENAPNFDPPDSSTCTFKRLLLNKCRVEFENRAQIAQEFENVPTTAANNDEQLDARFLAKRKMLGNIKFIGELGKLQIVHDSILHRCCKQLLVGRKKQPVSDQAEDLECLCHLMRTCGRILDTPIAKPMMDQYFERLQQAAESEQLPIRIRFMIQDIMEMRRNKWLHRKLGKTPEGPRTIQQVREDAYKEGCIYMPQQSPPNSFNKGGGGLNMHSNSMVNPLEGNFFDNKSRGANSKSIGGGDLFGGYMGGSAGGFFGTGPGTIHSEQFDDEVKRNNDNNIINNQTRDQQQKQQRTSNGHYSSSSRSPTSDQEKDQQQNSPKPFNNQQRDDNHFHYNNQRGNQQHREKLPDFGDRYSANRSKDRDRRNHQNPQFNNRGNNERYNNKYAQGDRSGGPSPEGYQNNRGYQNSGYQNNGGYQNNSGYQNNYQNNNFMNKMNDDHHNQQGAGTLPPRFKKLVLSQSGGSQAGGSSPNSSQMNNHGKEMEVSLRPQVANNMLFKPKTPSLLPKSAISKTDGSSPLGENSLLGPPLGSGPKVMMQQNAPIVIKQGSLDKNKRDKNKSANKGPTRDEVFAKMETILSDLMQHQSTNEALESWKENNWLPNKMSQTAVNHFMKLMLEKNETERDLAQQLLGQLVADGAINGTHVQEGISRTLSQLLELESNNTSLRSNLADCSTWCITNNLASFKEVAEMTQGGQNYPVFLQVLQRLAKSMGSDELKATFDASNNLKMVDFVPEESQNDESLVNILDEYQVSFLMPLLSVQQDMRKQLSSDPDPNSFLQWVNKSVDHSFFDKSDFINILFSTIMKYIVGQTTFQDASNLSAQPDKRQTEAERELVDKFKLVFKPFVQDNSKLQLSAVYALQVFCHDLGFPKGLLLRSFVNFYELDIMDEQAYLKWKEDVNDSLPGKGKALFQVNQWLTWLEEAESEEDEDDDENDE